MAYLQLSENEAESEPPNIKAEHLLKRLTTFKQEILLQLSKDGYIRELEVSGNVTAEPLYWCYHRKFELGHIVKTSMGFRIMFLNQVKGLPQIMP